MSTSESSPELLSSDHGRLTFKATQSQTTNKLKKSEQSSGPSFSPKHLLNKSIPSRSFASDSHDDELGISGPNPPIVLDNHSRNTNGVEEDNESQSLFFLFQSVVLSQFDPKMKMECNDFRVVFCDVQIQTDVINVVFASSF